MFNLSERGTISPERDEIVDEWGAELSGVIWSDFERWSGGSEHPRERGAEILTAQLCSHALVGAEDHEQKSTGYIKTMFFKSYLRAVCVQN